DGSEEICAGGGDPDVDANYADGPALGAALPFFFDALLVDDARRVYFGEYNTVRMLEGCGADGILTTIAGDYSTGSAGDGGRARDATVNLPTSLARDARGNLYIAEYFGGRVRKIEPAQLDPSQPLTAADYANGTITTLAVVDGPRGLHYDGAA